MKVTLAQLNSTIGDIEGNLAKMADVLSRCGKESSDLALFPELFLVGYTPRDLLERPSFIEKTHRALDELQRLSRQYPGTGILFGAPVPSGRPTGKGLHNSAILVAAGEVLLQQHKSLLPTYDVFDEARYFDAVTENRGVSFKGETLGISICEDAWNDPALWPRRAYAYDPIEVMAKRGATVTINISASPFHRGKESIRYRIARSHARKHGIPFVFVKELGAPNGGSKRVQAETGGPGTQGDVQGLRHGKKGADRGAICELIGDASSRD